MALKMKMEALQLHVELKMLLVDWSICFNAVSNTSCVAIPFITPWELNWGMVSVAAAPA